MPDLFYLVSKWWKQMLSIVVLSVITAAIIVSLKPSQYLSVATALPASSYATDKGSVFNDNTQLLYPALGTTDDLDVILGTGQLDTVYISVVKQFDLASHYQVAEQGEAAIKKAVLLLRKNTRVVKSEYNELKAKAWDNDKILAPQLANAIMEKIRDIHQDAQNSHNLSLIKGLQGAIEKLQNNIDSITRYLSKAMPDETKNHRYTMRRESLLAQVQHYEKLLNEYQLLADNKPPVLIIVEKARTSDWPDRPDRLLIIISTLVLSLLFSLLVAVFLEKRKP